MSEHCVVEFVGDDKRKEKAVKFLSKKWDAFHIDRFAPYSDTLDYWHLCISELNLRESLPMLTELQKKLGGIPFRVVYGVI